MRAHDFLFSSTYINETFLDLFENVGRIDQRQILPKVHDIDSLLTQIEKNKKNQIKLANLHNYRAEKLKVSRTNSFHKFLKNGLFYMFIAEHLYDSDVRKARAWGGRFADLFLNGWDDDAQNKINTRLALLVTDTAKNKITSNDEEKEKYIKNKEEVLSSFGSRRTQALTTINTMLTRPEHRAHNIEIEDHLPHKLLPEIYQILDDILKTRHQSKQPKWIRKGLENVDGDSLTYPDNTGVDHNVALYVAKSFADKDGNWKDGLESKKAFIEEMKYYYKLLKLKAEWDSHIKEKMELVSQFKEKWEEHKDSFLSYKKNLIDTHKNNPKFKWEKLKPEELDTSEAVNGDTSVIQNAELNVKTPVISIMYYIDEIGSFENWQENEFGSNLETRYKQHQEFDFNPQKLKKAINDFRAKHIKDKGKFSSFKNIVNKWVSGSRDKTAMNSGREFEDFDHLEQMLMDQDWFKQLVDDVEYISKKGKLDMYVKDYVLKMTQEYQQRRDDAQEELSGSAEHMRNQISRKYSWFDNEIDFQNGVIRPLMSDNKKAKKKA